MGFLTSIFGGGEGNIWTILFALAIVIVLIIGGVWALKLVFRASGSMTLGRQKRLAIIDTMAVDAKRSLVLIRRDDVEHLIITGATTDLVIETGIPVPVPATASTKDQGAGATDRIQPTMERATAAAQRLGLSSILRRKNDAALKEEPEVTTDTGGTGDTSPLDRLRNLGKSNEERPAPSLRHTGLLRPVSEMESVNLGAAQDNLEPENADSAKNEIDKADELAMESIEEGTNPQDAAAEAETLNDNQETSNKTG